LETRRHADAQFPGTPTLFLEEVEGLLQTVVALVLQLQLAGAEFVGMFVMKLEFPLVMADLEHT